ncbi:MAG: nucleoside hydrolase [Oscillospiraceae bacterium]|nr:nucleoside hydrolase [Oscillospiraceae bacterium]
MDTKKIPVIMDVDTGIDDAVAIILALSSPQLDVRGITVVAGNQTLDKTLHNTLSVVDYFGRGDVPVAAGADRPLVKALYADPATHGESGLGTARLPQPAIKPHSLDAVSFLRDTLEKSDEKITLVPVGPLTNIALLLSCYPHVKEKIERIVMMGGGAFEGNMNAVCEFNMFVDPEAAQIVFDSGVDIVMCGLDVTMKSYTTMEDILRLKATGTKAGDFCAEAFGVYYDRYVNNSRLPGCAVHDAVAVTYLLHPEWIRAERANVKLDIDGRETYGQTVCDFRPDRDKTADNALVCLDIDREKFVDLLVKACQYYK